MIVVGPFCPLVAIPRIRISKAAPGEPEVDVTLTGKQFLAMPAQS
jgi:hypothetical protein